MEIVNYVKLIVPSLAAVLSAKKQIVAHVSRKKYRRVSVRGLSPGSPPANFRLCLGNDTRQELSW